MADERVSIIIDVDVKDVASIAAVQAALANLNKSQKSQALSMRIMRGDADKTSKSLVGAAASANRLKDKVGKLGGAMKILSKIARILMFAVIGMGIEFLITAAALASVNLVFAAGKFLAKSYNFAMQALAGAVAAVGVAAIGAAAAFREFTAAQTAFRYKGGDNVAAGIDQATGALQNLYQDSTLATVGITSLNEAFAAVGKNSAFTPQTQAGLRAMMDFAAASGDTSKGLSSAATFLGIVQKESKFTQEALAAAKQIGPEFDKAFKKLRGQGKINTTADFFELLKSGGLAKEAGVLGAGSAVQQTLFAQFKGVLTKLYGEISSMGGELLNPFKKTLNSMFMVVRTTMRRISVDLLKFGSKDFQSGMVGMTEKISNFSVTLFRKFLPAVDGFFGRINSVYVSMYRYTSKFLDVIRPLREGGSVIIETFGKPISEVFKAFGRNIQNLADTGVKNKDKFLAFGDALRSFVAAFFDMSSGFKEAFIAALPIINKLVSGIALLMKGLGGIFRMLAGLGPLASFLGIFGTLVAGFKGKRGGRGGGMMSRIGSKMNGVPGAMTDADGLGGAMSAAGTKLSSSGDKLNVAADNLNRAAASQVQATAQMSNMLTTQMSALSQMSGQAMGGYAKPVLRGGRRNEDGTYRKPTRPLGMPQQMYDHNLKLWENQMAISDGDMSSVFGPAGSLGYAEGMANMHGTVGLEDFGTSSGVTSGFDMEGLDVAAAAKDKNAMHYKRMEKLDEYTTKMNANLSGAAAGMPISDPFGDPTGSGLTGATSGSGRVPFKQRFRKLTGDATMPWKARKAHLKEKLLEDGRAAKAKFGEFRAGDRLGLKKLGAGFMGADLAKERYKASLKMDQDAGRKPSRGRALKAGMGANLGLASMALGAGASAFLGSKMMNDGKGLDVAAEAQGSMQAGAAMAAMSPLAGIAVAGIGTALKSQTGAGGAISGAAGGAAAGAMIGSIIPGVGTIAGAIIGGTFAGIGGYFKGKANNKKIAKEAAKRASQANLVPVVNELLKGNTIGALDIAKKNTERMKKMAKSTYGAQNTELDRLVKEGVITKEERERTLNDPSKTQKFFDRTAAAAPAQEKVTKLLGQSFTRNMKDLQMATGKTEKEIMDLAHKMGVDLTNPMLTLKDAITELGEGAVKSAKEINYAITDNLLVGLEKLEKWLNRNELSNSARNSQNAFNAGPAEDTFVTAFGDMVKLVTSKTPNNAVQGFLAIREMLDPANPNYIFGKTGAFGGINNEKDPKKKQELINQGLGYVTDTAGATASTYTTAVGAKLANAGMSYTDTSEGSEIENAIQKLLLEGTPEQVQQLDQFIKYGNLEGKDINEVNQALRKILGLGGTSQGTDANNFDFTRRVENTEQTLRLAPIEKQILDEMTAAIKTGFGKASWWESSPEWWKRGLKGTTDKAATISLLPPEDDTSTPRAKSGDTSTSKRLRSTLGAHSRFNSKLTGKRTITSSLRFNNLGSPSSDHATGNAYDLTGQNLGQYAKMVNNSGGFAEFHGVNANRHLHVVPRSGDTSTSKAGSGDGSTGGAPNVTLNVYAGPNMSVDELVSKTMKAQARAIRDGYERR